VQSFCASYDELIDRIETRLREPAARYFGA
jgi:hypothetical protein